jgi:D-glycero-alpha-D-manno-heptose-7-phosphate kinase
MDHNTIFSKTPVRIDFGGGATDVEPYSSEYGGYVINVTINKYTKSVISIRNDKIIEIISKDREFLKIIDLDYLLEKKRKLSDLFDSLFYYIKPKKGMDIELDIEPPNKSGLGTSASLCTSLIAGFLKLNNKTIDKDKIAEMAYHVEQDVLKNFGGRQDQYASVYGGFNGMTFLGKNKVKVEKLKISKSFKQAIEEQLILFYTEEPHNSGNMVKKQIDSYFKDREESTDFLNILKQVALNIRDCLISEDFEKFGKLLSKDMNIKSQFNPYLLTNYMKSLHELVMNNGGIGGRVAGAGGGGCMIWLLEPKFKKKVKGLLNKQTGRIINFEFINKGLEISSM